MSTNKKEIEKVVCSKCGGAGQFRYKGVKGMCVKCKGEGSLDWIENVVGKKGFRLRPGVYTEGGIMARIFDDAAQTLCDEIDREIISGIKEDLYEQKHIKKRRIRKKVKI